MSDQLVAETTTYTTHNKLKRRTSTPAVGFEPAIPAIEQLQTYAFNSTAIGISIYITTYPVNLQLFWGGEFRTVNINKVCVLSR
jgi:hypothetical protein